MDKFTIKGDSEKNSTINRTIRIKSDVYDMICILSEIYNVSFNKITNQCLEYALNNLDDNSLKKFHSYNDLNIQL